jgi:signal transduction histidine kinase
MAAVAQAEASARGSRLEAEPVPLRALEVVTTIVVASTLTTLVGFNFDWVANHAIELLPWLAVVAVADLLPVPLWASVELMTSFPVLLAAAFVFPPFAAAGLSFIAVIDIREFRREISALRGLLNRSNVALSVFAAGTTFRALDGDVGRWPIVLVHVAPAVAIDVGVNATLLVLSMHLLSGSSTRDVLRNVYGGDRRGPFLVGYACFGLLALLLATVFRAAGTWGLVAFAVPLLLSRQMFVHWKDAGAAQANVRQKQRALSEVSTRIADERRDERLSLAAGIHDDVLPPLYQVHLMGEVLKRDLAAGRLLDLEADLPDLLHATQSASEALRDLIGDLRRSTIGPGGLAETIRLLIRQLETRTTARFEAALSDTTGTPLTQLLLYQIAREALTNAAVHSGAFLIKVSLAAEDEFARLQVDDDGHGFDLAAVDSAHHFGLQLMRERVELAGGLLVIDSYRGGGTHVVVRLPIGAAPR